MRYILFLLLFIGCNQTKETASTPVQVFRKEPDLLLSAEEEALNSKFLNLRNGFLNSLKSNFFNHTFEENKAIIDTSNLFRLIKSMPKGGALHLHSMGSADINWVFSALKKYLGGKLPW